MIKTKNRSKNRIIRHTRIRKKFSGSSEVPRFSVFRSSRNIYAQLIDDVTKKTLISSSSLTPGIRDRVKKGETKKVDVAKIVGNHIAELAIQKGIQNVCFDRGGYKYHGRVKALAEGAREAGLKF